MDRDRILIAVLLAAAVLLAGCRREDRDYRSAPPFGGPVRYFEDYEASAYSLSEGKQLFSSYNCVGCHAHGGGGMGPPLMDDQWLYGAEPVVIFDTISGGRPNGMPAFGGAAREPGITVVATVPEHQRWQLVAYVRSMSGLVSRNVATGRDDHMNTRPPENSTDPQHPRPAPEALPANRQAPPRGFGWVDRRKGIARIPIDRAIDVLIETERAKSAKKGGTAWRP